jgi:hypothetical protein
VGAARTALTGSVRAVAACAAAIALVQPADLTLRAQEPLAESREVRQLVTFRFLPGQSPAAVDIYRRHLVPIYRDVEAMRTVRVFAEVESPEPLDLMVVTHYATLAAMDRANAQLRRPAQDHPPVGELYRQLADLSFGHYDQLIEVISPPATAGFPDGALEVLEFLRLDRAFGPAFERQILDVVHPWEQQVELRDVLLRSETARFLLADGWDYLRTYAVPNLAAWQSCVTARGRHPAVATLNRQVAARKTIILREIADLRVR